MSRDSDARVRGERALRAGDVDRLGFSEIAARIATSLVDRASQDGFVVGIDGQWGSGKSSLLYLLSEELKRLPALQRPTTLSFSPWLVGNREALLTSLFNQLAEAIDGVQLARGDATGETLRKVKEAAELVRRFGAAVSKAGDLVQALSSWISWLGPIGKGLSGLGKLTSKKDAVRLDRLKDQLTVSLRELGHRFIVTVDDVDRLEPSEIIEVLRLVRSVADFPNIIYVLCYDSDILAEGVQRGANVPDGAAFLEKIVQLTVMVPRPETFQLRNWFAEEVVKIVAVESEEDRRRLREVIDHEGGLQLRTPRSVVRTLDSVRFFWPALRSEKIDVPDLVWLLLIKDGAPKLYRWIEAYLISISAVILRIGQMSKSGAEAELQKLNELLGPQYFEDAPYRHFFAEQLPGVEISYSTGSPPLRIFEKVEAEDQNRAIQHRRLASVDHHRLYFALIGPSHAITQAQIQAFWAATSIDAEATAQELRSLMAQSVSADLTKADLLLERLRGSALEAVTSAQAENLLTALGIVMDESEKPGSDYAFMVYTTWDRAERLVSELLRRIDPDQRALAITRLFSSGSALGWLTSLFRGETFAHGHFGDQRKAQSEWVLTEEEYHSVVGIMLARYAQLTLDQILSVPRALHVFFAWQQAGDDAGPKARMAEAAQTDAGLLKLLKAFISTTNTDRGTFEVLRRDNIKYFMDYDEVRSRVERMSDSALDADEVPLLARIRSAFQRGSR